MLLKRDMDGTGDSLGAGIWVPILCFFVIAAILFYEAGFQFADGGALRRLGPGLVMAACCYLVTRSGKVPRIGRLLSAFYQTALVGGGGMLLAYAAATLDRPLVDAELLAIDRGLGYDWSAYAGFFASHRSLAWLVIPAYSSLFLQPLILLVVLSASEHVRRLEQFVLASMVGLIVTIGLFAAFPATTAWYHLGIAESMVQKYLYLPIASDGWIRDLIELRAGGGRIIPGGGSALIAFPSYHCISALLYVWAAWPVRWLRPIFITLNILMLLATPLVGGHYVVDLIAGAGVMLASLAFVIRAHDAWLARSRAERSRRTAAAGFGEPAHAG